MTDRLVERWRQPVIPLAVRDDETTVTTELGRPTLDLQARFRMDDIHRFRLGYACLNCWEPHETPFPEACTLCGYPMRERQGSDFSLKFQGLERDPKALAIEKGLDRVDDNHERNFYESTAGILVPRSVKGLK